MKPEGVPVRSTARSVLIIAAMVVAVSGSWLVTSTAAVAAGEPAVTIAPGPAAGAFRNGQSVTVSVGPNSLFDPYSRVVIIECADPKGTVANLPTAFRNCDGDTVQANSVLVQKNGSFSSPNYTMYAVPNADLQEQANWTPVCSKTQYCVLYVGENYNDFSKPKVFSQPYLFTSDAPTISGGTATPTTILGSATGTGTGGTGAGVASASVSLSASTLAFTGVSWGILLVSVTGLILLGVGAVARRLVRGRGQ